MERLKLKFEALPPALHGKNIRSELGIAKWDEVRKKTYKKYNHTCAICGKTHMKCNAHEVWKLVINSKDSTGKQVLVNIINVCDECHDTIHIGRALALGYTAFRNALNHYAQVNQLSVKEVVAHIQYVDEKMAKLNMIKSWTIDLSLLDNDAYLQVFDII